MHALHIDIETFSSVDLQKSGLYRYTRSPDFRVLLLAWSLDGSPVRVEDLTTRPDLPPELMFSLFDPGTLKYAYNAAFEWQCLSRHFRLHENPAFSPEAWLPQWRCVMVHGLYCGFPAGLEAVGQALGLPLDKQKLSVGRALIRYFCVPCTPTKSNGGRTRNLPRHDPEKWALFKEYCRQDVVTEMAVEEKLRSFPVPDFIWRQWATDQVINARGAAVDIGLIEAARRCGDTVRRQLLDEAARLSGLDNPNSLRQLARWLEEELDEEIPDLTRSTVKSLLGRGIGNDAVRRMLEIRQALSKTSTKKYDAMAAAVCDDGRIRGLMQFYGANRTGRWAGRIVQPQNLPRTYIEPLGPARELVKSGRLDALELCYGSVPETLSQLIRTAFVAAPGHVLIDADFSAIEARVIAWLAGEEWRLEVFRTHGKIYEASAEQMFRLPPGSVKKGDPMRQRGKVAELALGYQGGPGALISMGALDVGLTEEELPDIVSRWRAANPRIVELWRAFEDAAFEAAQNAKATMVRGVTFARECDLPNGLDFMTIRLPSGRKLYYPGPCTTTNRFGRTCVAYRGTTQGSKKWRLVETYGGALVENVVQAIARDCLAEGIERLEAAGYRVVFHVHDEVVIEMPVGSGSLEEVCRLLAAPMPWAPDLPLAADGWVGNYYKKD